MIPHPKFRIVQLNTQTASEGMCMFVEPSFLIGGQKTTQKNFDGFC